MKFGNDNVVMWDFLFGKGSTENFFLRMFMREIFLA
jgi:hypothetical protein